MRVSHVANFTLDICCQRANLISHQSELMSLIGQSYNKGVNRQLNLIPGFPNGERPNIKRESFTLEQFHKRDIAIPRCLT